MNAGDGMGGGEPARDTPGRAVRLHSEQESEASTARHPSDSARQPFMDGDLIGSVPSKDETEIERLRFNGDIPGLASLARRLLRERDEAIGALDEGRNRLRAAEQGMDAADADYRVAAKERDEARRLLRHQTHKNHDYAPHGCSVCGETSKTLVADDEARCEGAR